MNRVKIIFTDDDPRWNYVRGAFQKPKPRLNNVGKKFLAYMENLTEDGELSTTETNRKERGILQDAKLLFTRFKCPKDVAEYSDYDLSKFVEG